MFKLKKNNGITLVALVITIIVLIILAGISISILLGEDGLINKAKNGGDKYKLESEKEQQTLADINSFIDGEYPSNNESEIIDDSKLYIIKNGITSNTFGTSNMDILNINENVNDSSVLARTDNNKSNRAAITFRNIDMTNYSKIGIDYKVSSKTGDSVFSLSVFQNNANINMDGNEKQTVLLSTSEYSKIRSIDYIEEIAEGIHDLSIMKNATLNNTKVDFNVYDLWLEKSNGQKEYIIEKGIIKYTYELLNTNILNESTIPNIFALTNSTNNRAGIYLNGQDLTEYSKVGIDYEVESKTGDAILYFALIQNGGNIESSLLYKTELASSSENSKQRTIAYIDEFDGETYFLAILKNATVDNTQVKYKIYNLWLEK